MTTRVPPSDTHPTIRDVASRAGVSPMTVSRALRGGSGVAEATRSRVLAAAAALAYRPNEGARNLRLGRTSGLLGLIVTNLANPFYAQLALGVEEHAASLSMRVIFANSGNQIDRERQLIVDFASRRLDGVIVVPAGSDHGHFDPNQLGGLPVVFATSPPSGPPLDSVLLDDFGGTREAIGLLIRQGHRRIGFLGLRPATWTGSERFRGYCTALEEAGIALDDRYVHRHRPDSRGGEHAARELLTLAEPPTALFAANNRNTIGAYRAIRAGGRETALSGFDDFELADMLPIALSVVSYDPRELGRQAARLLCERLDGGSASLIATPRRVVISTRIIDYPAPGESSTSDVSDRERETHSR